jgi:hypothetical protein
VGVIAQGPAQLDDRLRERVVAHDTPGQIVESSSSARDGRSWTARKMRQDMVTFGSSRTTLAIAAQLVCECASRIHPPIRRSASQWQSPRARRPRRNQPSFQPSLAKTLPAVLAMGYLRVRERDPKLAP